MGLPMLIDAELDGMLSRAIARISIPESTRDSLLDYLRHGVPCGSFLTAVLENDLYKSFVRADDENRAALTALVQFLVEWAPIPTWGSPLAVREWIESGVKTRAEREIEVRS